MQLAGAIVAARRDGREIHIARNHVDPELRHLLRHQRAPDHARRLIVGDHQIEFKKRRRGLGRADHRRRRQPHRGAADGLEKVAPPGVSHVSLPSPAPK
jgi:hypothetical protein